MTTNLDSLKNMAYNGLIVAFDEMAEVIKAQAAIIGIHNHALCRSAPTDYNELVMVIKEMASIIEVQAATIEARMMPTLQISATDPRQTFVDDNREAQPL